MGSASQSLQLVALGFVGNERRWNSNVGLKAQSRRRRIWKGSKRARILMKRRARLQGYRRPANEVEKRVRVLRKLVPERKSVGLDGLFRDTAEYIQALEMRVKVMQMVVKALSGSDE